MTKRFFAVSAFLLLAVCASSQTMQDALTFSSNNYYGTARSMAMGNAFTALGGDLGSITLNPAGSAVNGFSQLTITPGLSIASSRSSYMAMPSLDGKYANKTNNGKTAFEMPNVGFTLNYKTGAKRGLKSSTIGFIANMSSVYLDNVYTRGRNSQTTMAGSIAAGSSGMAYSQLNDYSAYDSGLPWLNVAGLQGGMISNFGATDSEYIGVTEKLFDNGDIQLAGPIDQVYGRQTKGTKYEMVFNSGLNFSDRVFVGVNIGMASLSYSMDQYFKEVAVNPADFQLTFVENNAEVTTNFDALRYRYSYDASGVGVYGKIGIIGVPTSWLRLGAAIQTPTLLHIKESWQLSAETWFTNSSFDASSKSPRSEYEYNFISPFRFNVGAAIILSKIGVLSTDYEYTDYAGMRFKESETNDNSAFESVNNDISDYMSDSNTLRLGAEVKLLPIFAVRAGYELTSTKQKYLDDLNEMQTQISNRNTWSVGFGYSSKGSFFCDFALRHTAFPKEYIYPYQDYLDTALTPEILHKRSLWDAAITFGWRF